MTNTIPPGLDRSPMGQWAKVTAPRRFRVPFDHIGITYFLDDRVTVYWSGCDVPFLEPGQYIAVVKARGTHIETETGARLRWEAEMMARHGETVQGVEGNPWIGWAEDTNSQHSHHIWNEICTRKLAFIYTDCLSKIAFLRPSDTAREAELRAQLSPDLDPTREGSGRVLNGTTSPAPERVEPALQVGTLAEQTRHLLTRPTVVVSGPKVETWEEHVARRFRLTWCRSVLDEHYQTVAGQRYKNDPPQHPLTTPPDKTPTLDIFWRRG